uniref:Uncharacterized protein n=1 Tax=Romanomermis culicivorax TaxID=13658 RepID=A0A915HPC5_ROMCU
MFTAKCMMWVVEEAGETWDGACFRQTVLLEHVIPLLNDEENAIRTEETTFVHGPAPCMRANATQQLLCGQERPYCCFLLPSEYRASNSGICFPHMVHLEEGKHFCDDQNLFVSNTYTANSHIRILNMDATSIGPRSFKCDA